uniref:Uncharacterized protein n=1 Tax=Ralstonia solanacearum TaxID=305 RepID=A0A0S4U8X7_RALSL|nr:protein of unknown function [Ralstonia solanacearum]
MPVDDPQIAGPKFTGGSARSWPARPCVLRAVGGPKHDLSKHSSCPLHSKSRWPGA